MADFQHGFEGHEDCLEYSSFVLKSMEEMEDECQVDSIYTNFSKAFDKVCHRLLLDKMTIVTANGVKSKLFKIELSILRC
jgi:hypothetical protein